MEVETTVCNTDILTECKMLKRQHQVLARVQGKWKSCVNLWEYKMVQSLRENGLAVKNKNKNRQTK